MSGPSASGSALQAETLEHQVSDLYDLSLDITRHESDIEFARAGGTIHYTFDQNVFELFLRPFDRYAYVMRQNEVTWNVGSSGERRRQTAIQSALLTGEVLFGGSLPGQKTPTWYITEWHRWEFMERISTLLGDSAALDPVALAEAARQGLLAKEALAYPEKAASGFSGADDAMLGLDLADLEEHDGAELLPAFLATRRAAAVLANDRFMEPISQLTRLLEADERGAIVNVGSLGTPPKEEMNRLARAAREWSNRLRSESNLRAARNQATQKKGAAARWSDARSLALLEWLSGSLDPAKERVVLVTGDPSLFDAYRRQFEDDRELRGSEGRQFLVRRPVQYSTLFSAREGRGTHSRQLMFYTLQQIVELPLAPMRAAADVDPGLPEDVRDRRHSLTLRRIAGGTVRTSYFHDAWKAYGAQYSPALVAGWENDIDSSERILNGLGADLLLGRIGQADRQLLETLSNLQVPQREAAIDEYVDRRVADMIRAAVKAWTPVAEEFFRSAARKAVGPSRRPVPLAVHLPDDLRGGHSRLASLLDELTGTPSGPKPKAELSVGSSFGIFIGAAAVAVYSNQWRLGDHLSEVAINAFRYFAASEGTTDRDAAEAHYLSAMAKRFRLGDLRPREIQFADPAAARLYRKAVKLLETSEELSGSIPDGFVVYRCASERAALDLFFATFCLRQAEEGGQARVQDEVGKLGAQALRDAGEALEQALELRNGTAHASGTGQGRQAPFEIVDTQVLVNIAAWFALSPIVSGRGSGRESSSSGNSRRLADHAVAGLPRLETMLTSMGSALFEAEMLAFKLSQGIDVARSRELLVGAVARAPGERLDSDRALLELLGRCWLK